MSSPHLARDRRLYGAAVAVTRATAATVTAAVTAATTDGTLRFLSAILFYLLDFLQRLFYFLSFLIFFAFRFLKNQLNCI